MSQDELLQLSQNMWLCKKEHFSNISCTELIAIVFTAIKIRIVLLTSVFSEAQHSYGLLRTGAVIEHCTSVVKKDKFQALLG